MELAIHTGKPHFEITQHVGGPIVEPETAARFHRLSDEAFGRNYLTNNGPLLRTLEEEVAARHRVAHAVVVNNATIAQMILLKAMGLDRGEAVVSANTFVATPHSCLWQGMKVRFADIDPVTLAMSAADFERKITPDTTAVIPTHVFGVFADMPAIKTIADRRGIHVLADAAHAFDCDRAGIMAGGFGAPEFISFHATKFFSTLEGGAIVTNDDELARELRALRDFGHDRPGETGMLGINAKVSEIHAAFGLASLPALEERRALLETIRQTYIDELSGVSGVRIHPIGADGRNNFRYFALFVEEGFGLPRDVVLEVLKRENIAIQLYFYPGCQRLGYYRRTCPEMVEGLPEADRALGSILCLPTSFVHAEPIASARAIAAVIRTAQRRSGEVMDWWRAMHDSQFTIHN